MTAVEKASQQLRTSLRNEATSPEEIKKQLAALRTAREAAKKELAVAQQDLRKAVNIRQEAQLVLMGLLD
jgi:Mg-chelatase subunit ChlD